jgi:hypothetical protein
MVWNDFFVYSSRAGRRTVEKFFGLEYISDRIVRYNLEHLVDKLEKFTVQQTGPNYSAHIMCALTECTSNMLVFGLMMVQWTEICRRIFNIDYQYVLFLLTK